MKTKKLLVLASSLILLTACGGAPESSSSSQSTGPTTNPSSSSSTRPSSSSTPAPSSSSSTPSTPVEPTRPATYAGFAYWAYEGSTRGADFHEDVKWEKGATWTWTFTANKAVENAWLTVGAKMTSSSHASRTLFTDSNGADSSDAFESNPENDGTPRLTVNLNGEDKALTNTKTYGDVLSTDEYRDLDLVHPVSIKEGKNVLKIGTNANVGYRLYLGEQVRFFYEGTGLELTLGAPAESSDTTPVESSDTTPIESSDTTPVESSSDVATVSALELDTANVKKVYMVGDAFDPTGLGVKALLSDGSEVPLTSTDYTIAADFKTAGAEVDVTVSYGTVDASFKVKVGEYAATAVDIANVEGKAIVTISGTYGVLSAEEFKSFDWSTDFQVNGYKGGTWAGPWTEVANGAIEFTMGEGTWSFTRDVTEVADEYYTGHFGHKMVRNNNGDLQKMDLKIKADEDASKNVKIGDRTYTINYNVGHDEDPIYCWGNASLTVETANAPVWGVDSVKVVEDPVETGTAAIEFKVAFENYTEAAFRALKWNVDFEGNGNYSNGWSGINAFAHDFGDKWAIKDGVATFYLNVDSLCLGGYTLHFGVGDLKDDKAPDFKPESFTASNMVVDGATYDLVCNPGSTDGKEFWGCVGLVIGVDGEHNPTATFTNARVRLDDGIPHLGLFGIQNDAGRKVFYYDTQENGGSWKTTIRESTVYVTGDNWTIDSDISGIENGTYIIHWHCGNKQNDMPNFPDESLSSVSYQGRVFSLKHVAAGWDAGVTITALVIENASN